MITDSGGIQEEAPALGKPVLVTREITERIEGVDAGTLALVGTDPDRIFDVGRPAADRPDRLRGDGARRRTPTATGKAAERIVARWSTCIAGGAAPAPFGSSLDRRAVLAATGAVEAEHRRPACNGMPDSAQVPAASDVREAS